MSAAGPTVRRLTASDAEVSRRLGQEAFGMPTTPPTEPAILDLPGMITYGVFDGDRLMGRVKDRAYDSWFGGSIVPTCGIAGVTVAMEDRGRGVLSSLLRTALAEARERGAVISGLFPTAARIYRRLGYELVGDYRTVTIKTSELAAVTAPASVRTRRAMVTDLPAVRELYDSWAAAQNGPLTRRGISFPATDAAVLDDFDAVTVAVDATDQILGYALWDRGQHYDERGTLRVSDLVASSADGYRALLRALGSFSSVTPTTTIDTSGDDLVRLFLPGRAWETVSSDPYMIAIIDAPGAFSRRGYPWFLSARLGFRVVGDHPSDLDGPYRLEVAEGVGTCTAEDHSDDRTFHPRGLALLYAGVQSCANVRRAGLLAGGLPEQDGVWDTLFGGRQFHIRDYY